MASLNIANIAAHRCHKWRALLMTLCTPSITSVTAARLGAGRGEVYLNKPQTRVPRPARPGLGWGRGSGHRALEISLSTALFLLQRIWIWIEQGFRKCCCKYEL